MSYRFRSADGLAQSNDAPTVASWDVIGATMAEEQAAASTALRQLGVKMEHPDDGWVDRQRNVLRPCYPQFDLSVQPGDLIALGWPWKGYRLVRCTDVTTRSGPLLKVTEYAFIDDGQRWPS